MGDRSGGLEGSEANHIKNEMNSKGFFMFFSMLSIDRKSSLDYLFSSLDNFWSLYALIPKGIKNRMPTMGR